MTLDSFAGTARAAWLRFEPLHAVTYFAPEARTAFEEAGLRGFWRGYFAGRSAPLGAVTAGPVVAIFFGFAPGMVRRALPDVWSRATPERVLAARVRGAQETLSRLLSGTDPARIARAALLARAAVEAAELGGRPLAAANRDLDWPSEPLPALWQACTILREHRGDGHVAALVAAGVNGCESLVLRDALYGERATLQPNRGWSDEEWEAARARLAGIGWLSADGTPTDRGRAAHQAVEENTDRLAAGIWYTLGQDRSAELIDLLDPLATAAATVLPSPNPIGLPTGGRPSEG